MPIAFALLAAALSASLATPPRAPAAAPRGALTVDEILARYVEARGGAAKLDTIRSVRWTGRVVFGGGDRQLRAEF
jgi:hypothetical protein